MLNQVKIVQDNLKNFFKYEKNFNDCLKDVKIEFI